MFTGSFNTFRWLPLFQLVRLFVIGTLAGPLLVDVNPVDAAITEIDVLSGSSGCQNCFPALGFAMPGQVPNSLNSWWCSMDCEHAFMGFSYEVTACMLLQ